MDGGRYDHIDLLEFIAMLFVIVYHGTTVPFNFIEQESVIRYINYLIRPMLSVCVPLFFLANGYLLFSKSLNLKKHFIKTTKIVIITIIWRMVTIAGLLFLIPGNKKQSHITEFFLEVLRGDQGYISHLWFMGALVCIYIFFPLLKVAYDNNKKVFFGFICTCAFITFGNKAINMLVALMKFIFTGNISGIEDVNYFNMFNPFVGICGYTFVYFGIGGLLFYFQSEIKERVNRRNSCKAILGLGCSILALAGWGIFRSKASGEIWDIVWNGYDTLFNLLNVLLIYFLSMNYKPKKRGIIKQFIQMVSCNTMGIYFLHVLLLYPTLIYIKSIPLFCSVGMNIVYAFGIMCVCVLLSLLLKKVPLIRELI